MSVRISVVTPAFCLHVADVGADGVLPVRRIETPRVTGLVSASARPDTFDAIGSAKDRFPPTLPPPGFSETLRDLLTRRWDRLRADEGLHAGTPATLLMSGWGKKPDYGHVAFRYTITNWEHDEDVETDEFGVSPQFATYGGDYKHADGTHERPFNATIAGLGQDGPRLRDKVNGIARAIKKGRGADDVALACKALIDAYRTLAPAEVGPGVLLANLTPDGAVEAAVIDASGARGAELAALV